MQGKALGFAVCAVLLTAPHAADVFVRNQHIQALLRDERSGAEAVAARYGVSLDDCGYKWSDPLHALVRAIFTAERFATPYLVGQVRATAVHVFRHVGLPPPDISLGVGRMRLSTARKYLNRSVVPESNQYGSLPDHDLAQVLLDRCHSFRVGLIMLNDETHQYIERFKDSNARLIRHATRAYAGRAEEWTSLEAALSHEVYYRLVYNVFQIYRFEGLSRSPAE
jgi:hypothetical protein